MSGPGFERLKATPGAEAVRQDTVATQAKARAEAEQKIRAARKAKPKATKSKTAKTAKSTRLTDDMKIVIVKRENPFTKGSEIFKRAEYVLNAHNRTVAAAKRGRDGTVVRAMVDRGLVKVVAARA
jgi:hypothetical protein